MCMSSHVGPVIVGVFPQEEKVVPKEFGGQQVSSAMKTNILFEQGKPRCI
jgi:hypothetical protein